MLNQKVLLHYYELFHGPIHNGIIRKNGGFKMRKLKYMVIALIMVFALVAPISLPITGTVAEAATVSISKAKLTLKIGGTATLKITGTKGKITWKTDKKTVATVTSKGVVTAQTAGTAKITATVDKKNYTCTVTVSKPANPYQLNADLAEVEIGGLSVVVPALYTTKVVAQGTNAFHLDITMPSSKSTITVDITKTDEDAIAYEDIKAYYGQISQDSVQAQFDSAYGANKFVVSDFDSFDYESQNGTTSFVNYYTLTTKTTTMQQVIYDLSIDGYSIEVVVTDAEGLDLYKVAQYLIDSLMYK